MLLRQTLELVLLHSSVKWLHAFIYILLPHLEGIINICASPFLLLSSILSPWNKINRNNTTFPLTQVDKHGPPKSSMPDTCQFRTQNKHHRSDSLLSLPLVWYQFLPVFAQLEKYRFWSKTESWNQFWLGSACSINLHDSCPFSQWPLNCFSQFCIYIHSPVITLSRKRVAAHDLPNAGQHSLRYQAVAQMCLWHESSDEWGTTLRGRR